MKRYWHEKHGRFVVSEIDALAAIEKARREAEIATWAKAGAQRNLDVEQARREEREACAKVCDDLSTTGEDDWSITRSKAFFDAGRAIRARGAGK